MPVVQSYIPEEVFELLRERAKASGLSAARYAASLISQAMIADAPDVEGRIKEAIRKAGKPLALPFLVAITQIPKALVSSAVLRMEQLGGLVLSFEDGLPAYAIPRAAQRAPVAAAFVPRPTAAQSPGAPPEEEFEEHDCEDLECPLCFTPAGVKIPLPPRT